MLLLKKITLWVCRWIARLGFAGCVSYLAWFAILYGLPEPLRQIGVPGYYANAASFAVAEIITWPLLFLLLFAEKVRQRFKLALR